MTIIQSPESFKSSRQRVAALVEKIGEEPSAAIFARLGLDPAEINEWSPDKWRQAEEGLSAAVAPEKSALHLAALAYAAKGWPVFPCLEGLKVPATANGLKDASKDPAQIDAWWTENKNYNVAFEPECAGLAVIDADTYHEGCNIEALHLPETYEVNTPRGGTHYYFLGSVPTTVGDEKKPEKGLGAFVDTRGRGSYALLPPSSIPEFGDYIVKAERPFAKLPDEITAKLAKRDEPAKASSDVQLDLPGNIARAKGYLENCIKGGRVAKVGHRGHDTCYEIACGLVRDLGISTSLAIELMLDLWYPHCTPNDDRNFVRERVLSAGRNGQNAKGAYAAPPPEEAFAGANFKAEEQSELDPSEPAFEIFDRWDFKTRKPLKWIIDGLVRDKSLHTIYGDSETFKTFHAVDLGCSIAYGMPAFGEFEVFETGDVVLCCDEDPDDVMTVRYPAWCKAHGIEDPFAGKTANQGRFVIIPRCPEIANPQEIPALIKKIKASGLKPKLIIIDTRAKAMVGLNEDSSKDNGILVKAMGDLRRIFGCATMLIHHPKKGEDEMRGTSAQRNDGDIVFLTKRPDKAGDKSYDVWWLNQKMKSAPKPSPFLVRGTLFAVDVFDQHGIQVTAPVFRVVRDAAAKQIIDQRPQKKSDLRKYERQLIVREYRADIDAIYEEGNHKSPKNMIMSDKELSYKITMRRKGLEPRDEAEARNWEDERNKHEEWLGNHSKHEDDDPRGDLYGLFKRVSSGHKKRAKRWFAQEAYLTLKAAEANGGALLGDLPDDPKQLH